MDQVFSIVGKALSGSIGIIQLLLLLRAVFSWIPKANESKLGKITYSLTEPILIPFRRLAASSSVARNSFVDIAFILAIITLEVLKRFVSNIF